MKVCWVPRRQNEEADALTNDEFGGFDENKRVHLDPASVDWVVLPKMLEVGGGMVRELEEKKRRKKEERQASKAAKKRLQLAGEALRDRDPW